MGLYRGQVGIEPQKYKRGFVWDIELLNAFTYNGETFFFTKILEVSIGRDLRALKGRNELQKRWVHLCHFIRQKTRKKNFFFTKILEVCIGRDLRALKGRNELQKRWAHLCYCIRQKNENLRGWELRLGDILLTV